MKKLLLLLAVSMNALIAIPLCNAQNNPYIMIWDINSSQNINLKVTGGTPYKGQAATSPGVGGSVNAGYPYAYVLFSTLDIDVQNLAGVTLYSTTIKMVNDGTNTYPQDINNYLVFSYNATNSYYGANAWENRNYFNITANAIPAPATITNEGWNSGMGNTFVNGVSGNSFWAIDYGSELGRWTVYNKTINQSTMNYGYGSGSRAYAVGLTQGTDGQWSGTAGIGVAKDGLWQIDIKIGSNGTLNKLMPGGTNYFCETFYLAERINLTPGVQNYLDGSPAGGDAGYGREIDIMETSWQAAGPQINLPGGGNTGWILNPQNGSPGVNQKVANWSDVGGAPTSTYVTFGCLIRDNNIWFYAYKADGSQWYATDAIPLNNSSYQQQGNFVPYIGTWSCADPAADSPDGGFATSYNNFVYLKQDDAKIAGLNPKDNPTAFGKQLSSYSLTKSKPLIVRSRKNVPKLIAKPLPK